jgi:hypothetical protein
MQHWLSGYANWYAKRNRRTGHLFQGRFKAFHVQDESNSWTLSRYIHLNPCRLSNPLVPRPDQWAHSSFAGYARKCWQKPFVQYNLVHNAWQGECGGNDPVRAYRRYVAQGWGGGHEDPRKGAGGDWVSGTNEFFKRMVAIAEGEDPPSRGHIARRLKAYTTDEILEVVAHAHDTDASQYSKFRSPAPGREMAALLCRRYTGCTLAELSAAFGLGHPSSSANLVFAGKTRKREFSQCRQKMLDVENMMQQNIEN